MSEIRKQIAFAISDPGHTGEGYKGERTLTEWQTDAVMRIVSELEKASVAYVDANTGLIAEMAKLREELARTERNRDMWKGQVERQSEHISQLRSAIMPLADKLSKIVYDGEDHPLVSRARAALQPTSGGEADV